MKFTEKEGGEKPQTKGIRINISKWTKVKIIVQLKHY